MKWLMWILILFGIAVGVSLFVTHYPGEVLFVVNQEVRRINLNTFIIANLVFVVLLYVLIRLVFGVLNLPARFRTMRANRQMKNGSQALSLAGMAYFEGRFQKAEEQASKVMKNEHAKDNHALALMVATHSVAQLHDVAKSQVYLEEVAKLPKKMQLPRHLLLAEMALEQHDYEAAKEALSNAQSISPNLVRTMKLTLRLAAAQKDPEGMLHVAAQLRKVGALTEAEAEQYNMMAYRLMLVQCVDAASMKSALKKMPEADKQGVMCLAVAQKYQQLGLFASAVEWVKRYYPENHDSTLLPVFADSVHYLDEAKQRKAMELAESWLKTQPKDARLLLCLGQLALKHQLWGKAQSYLEASLSLAPSVDVHLSLAQLFEITDKASLAEQHRQQALQLVEADVDSGDF